MAFVKSPVKCQFQQQFCGLDPLFLFCRVVVPVLPGQGEGGLVPAGHRQGAMLGFRTADTPAASRFCLSIPAWSSCLQPWGFPAFPLLQLRTLRVGFVRKRRRVSFLQHWAAVRGLFCSSNNTRN